MTPDPKKYPNTAGSDSKIPDLKDLNIKGLRFFQKLAKMIQFSEVIR